MCVEDLKTQIHQLRNSCGSRRQSSFADKLEKLSEALSNCGKSHPYSLNDKLEDFVDQTKIFSEGTQGILASIKDENYLYRVQSLRGFLKNVEWADLSINYKVAKEVWNKLVISSKRTSDGWLKLDRFVQGTYPLEVADVDNLKWWNFAWWTTHSLLDNLILGAAKIGMCSTWISNENIVLRASVKAVKAKPISFVPTIIDAFLQPIFYPVEEMPAPTSGVTIDLSNDNLGIGVDEYVIKPIEVNAIEIFPIPIEDDFRKLHGAGCEENTHLLRALIDFYQYL